MSLQTGSKRQLLPRLRRLLEFAVLEAAEGIDVVVKDSTVVSAGFSPEVLFINIGARARALFPAKFWRPSRRRSFRGRRAGGFARRGFMGQAPLEVGLVWLESRDFCESCMQASCWWVSVHQCLRERRSPSRGTRPGRREACRGRHGGWLVSWLSCILSWDVRAHRGRRRMLGFCD